MNLMPYFDFRPGSQNGRCGHSGGPPRTSGPEYEARSLSLLRLCLVAKSLVTAKAFSSVAWDGSSTTMPALAARARAAVSVACSSGEAFAGAFAPFCLVLRNSVNVDRYSGTTSTPPPLEPFSRAGSTISRAPRAFTVAS